MLVGRETELEAVRSALAGQDGDVVVVALEGEAGIGKTAVWSAALRACAPDTHVCISRPVEAEASYSFAALGDLLAAHVGRLLGQIPPPQRAALEVALLRREAAETPLEIHAVAAGLLSALRTLSDEAAVVVAIDDLQWMDPASATALTYALRRVQPSERLRFLFSCRTDGARPLDVARGVLPERVRHIELTPLSLGALQRLLGTRLGWTPPRPVARRIQQVSGGNPFYALELCAALLRRGGKLDPSGELPVPATLEALAGSRLDDVSEEGQRAVLITALLAEPHERLVATASGGSGGPAAALDAGLLTRDGTTLRLAHPLFGSMIHARTPSEQLRAAHLELAELVSDDEQRARHLALGSLAPDEQVAAQLEQAALAAEARGAPSAAAQLAENAWRFTDPAAQPARTRRLLYAAERHWRLGAVGQPEEMLNHDLPQMQAGPDRARALLLLGRRGSPTRFIAVMDQALLDADPETRASILAEKAFFTAVGDATSIEQAHAWSIEAHELALGLGNPQLRTICGITLRWTEALLGRDVDSEIAKIDANVVAVFDDPGRLRAVRAMWRGEVAQARALIERLLAQARAREEEWSAFVMVSHMIELHLRVGDWRSAERACENLRLFELPYMHESDAAQRRFHSWIAAASGDHRRVQSELEPLSGNPATPGWQALDARRALGFAALLSGDASTAVAHLRAVADAVAGGGIREPGAFPVAPDLVQALVEAGELEPAHEMLGELEQLSAAQAHPWGLAAGARCRGLLFAAEGRDEAAEQALGEALERWRQLGLRFDHARTELDLGALLRRLRRRREARLLLERAAEEFDRLGSPPLAARARDELARLGGRRPRAGLTPSERRVAQLVAEGLTNAEIAAALVVTNRAVEAHLTRIYGKFGVRSRTQLARKILAVQAEAGAAAQDIALL